MRPVRARSATARLALATLAALSLAGTVRAQTAPSASASPFRYDDDPDLYLGRDDLYGRLKALPLGGGALLSLGADLRERVEASDVMALGLRGRDADGYDLHRLLVYGDLRLNSALRVFVQLGDHDQVGRTPGPSPLDVDRLDLSQGFVDVSGEVGPGRALLRVGRAEMSFDDGALIGLRDGPNVRQVWDGARLIYTAGAWTWNAFAVRPVSVKPGAFDDGPLPGQSIEGLHLTVAPQGPWAVDAFYFHDLMPQAALFGAAGHELTDTAGVRLRGRAGAFDGSVGAVGQGGSADGREVRAFALHGDLGAGLPLAWTPHVALRADVLSGGDPHGSHVGTFNALYPNVAYSTEATIEAPANLIQPGVVLSASPGPTVSLQYTLEGLWRFSTRDAFYAAPLFPLVRPDGSRDAWSGLEQQLRGVWRINAHLTLTSALVHFSAGSFVRRGGGSDETFGMTSLALRL